MPDPSAARTHPLLDDFAPRELRQAYIAALESAAGDDPAVKRAKRALDKGTKAAHDDYARWASGG